MDSTQQFQQQPSHRPHKALEWREPTDMAGLSVKIFFLRLITLGIYYFWGKTRVRRQLWSAVHLMGQPFQYTGTGMELFLGALIVGVVVIVPLIILYNAILIFLAEILGPWSAGIAVAFLIIVGMYLLNVAVYRARNYRLSRTNWRGIRGHMAGSSWAYGLQAFLLSLTVWLTLGWSKPWVDTYLYRKLTNETCFGDVAMRFDGSAGPLYRTFAVCWFICALILGIFVVGTYIAFQEDIEALILLPNDALLVAVGIGYGVAILLGLMIAIASAWYVSCQLNHFMEHTTFDQARFGLVTTPWGLIGLVLINFVLLLFSFGMLFPVIQARIVGYMVQHMDVLGDIDFEKVAQSQAALSKTGEGLAEAFEVDAF